VQSVAGSSYHGLLTGVKHESKYAIAAINYSWSHALDEVSNGGILPFGFNAINPVNPFNLAQYNYGNADYDIRQNMNGNYILKVPYFGGPKLLTDQWQLGGTIFWHSGFPFSVTNGAQEGALEGVNDFGPVYDDIVGSPAKNCGKSATTTPCLSTSNFADITGFGDPGYQRRNQFTGPHYFNTDLSVMKGFKVPGLESGLFQVGAQAYNVLNHTNFAQPVFDASNPAFGLIQGDVSTPTSVFGAFLGADADPRIIQLKGKFTF
jgi:hypothetical protein